MSDYEILHLEGLAKEIDSEILSVKESVRKKGGIIDTTSGYAFENENRESQIIMNQFLKYMGNAHSLYDKIFYNYSLIENFGYRQNPFELVNGNCKGVCGLQEKIEKVRAYEVVGDSLQRYCNLLIDIKESVDEAFENVSEQSFSRELCMEKVDYAFDDLHSGFEEEYGHSFWWVSREKKYLKFFILDSCKHNRLGFENVNNGIYLRDGVSRDFLLFEYPLTVWESGKSSGVSYDFSSEVFGEKLFVEEALLGFEMNKKNSKAFIGNVREIPAMDNFISRREKSNKDINLKKYQKDREDVVFKNLKKIISESEVYYDVLEIAEKISDDVEYERGKRIDLERV